MKNTKRVIFITYSGAELLDLAGPMSAFNTAARISDSAGYQCSVVSAAGGLVTHSCGTEVNSQKLADTEFQTTDTVLVIGADAQPLQQAIDLGALSHSLRLAASRVDRYGSICSGSFLLGAAGLLEGKQIATHWAAVQAHESMFEHTQVDRDSLYVNDGRLWSSAGVTTGIDMALAMVEQDHGRSLKTQVAKLMVVYSHRPGHQAQFSDLLIAQSRTDDQFEGLLEWLNQRLSHPPQVEEMAAQVNMSARSFSRKFKSVFDCSPGKFLERLRLDRARQLIESGQSTKAVAPQVGFLSLAAFRSAFKAAYGVTPQHHFRMSEQTENQT